MISLNNNEKQAILLDLIACCIDGSNKDSIRFFKEKNVICISTGEIDSSVEVHIYELKKSLTDCDDKKVTQDDNILNLKRFLEIYYP